MSRYSDDESDDSVKSFLLPENRTKSKTCHIPVRYVFLLMAFLGFNVLYSLRVNLSVAIVSMAREVKNSSKIVVKTECYNPDSPASFRNSSSQSQGEFDWSPKVQSYILGSFFIGYMVTQIPGGRLAERFGSKRILAGSILLASLLNILSPTAARIDPGLFIACRILIGLAEGLFFPSMHAMAAKWFPKADRSFMTALIYSGAQIGTVITMVSTGYLIELGLFGGWPSAFYVFGSFGVVWFALWMLLIYESPQDHPRITQQELDYHSTSQVSEKNRKHGNTPWRAILTSPAVWALVAAHFGQNWGFYTLLFELPTYLKTILGLDIKQNGVISGLPYFLQASVGWVVGYGFDRWIKKGSISVNAVRKLTNTIGLLGPAMCLIGLTLAKCDYGLSVALLFVAMALNGFTYSGYNATHVDMAPDYAGTLMGITNCLANSAGVLAPAYVGYLTDKEVSLASWSKIFYTAFVVYILTTAVFVIFGSAELQPWARSKQTSRKDEEKQ